MWLEGSWKGRGVIKLEKQDKLQTAIGDSKRNNIIFFHLALTVSS